MTSRRLLRALAVAIAVLGVIDPAITSDGTATAEVAVIAAPEPAGPAAESTADRVARALAGRYRVVRGPSAAADVTIVAGTSVPSAARVVTGPALAVVPARDAAMAITRLDAPARVPFQARATIDVTLYSTATAATPLVLTLEENGVVLDRIERSAGGAPGAPETIEASLTFVPAREGTAALRVRAALSSPAVVATADFATDVTSAQWAVLFYDARPSWQSTFVRRAVERDPRFDVRSLIRTTTNVVTASGGPAVAIGRSDSLAPFDAIVVGAPDALSSAEVASLSAYARRRGGAVILLLDGPPTGAVRTLTGAAAWREIRTTEPADLDVTALAPGLGALRGAEVVVPDPRPAGIDLFARASGAGAAWPAIFETPQGAGRVIVSGSVDAWQHRGVPETSTFDAFWRLALARAASASPPPLGLTLEARVLRPGQATVVRVVQRDITLADPATSSPAAQLSAWVEGPAGRSPLRLWPDQAPGRWIGEVRAPVEPGLYTVEASDDEHRAAAPLFVADDAREATPVEPELVAAWAASRGGPVVTSGTPAELRAAVDAVVRPRQELREVRPMRSAWWIVPFALAISGEWWLRRRVDLR